MLMAIGLIIVQKTYASYPLQQPTCGWDGYQNYALIEGDMDSYDITINGTVRKVLGFYETETLAWQAANSFATLNGRNPSYYPISDGGGAPVPEIDSTKWRYKMVNPTFTSDWLTYFFYPLSGATCPDGSAVTVTIEIQDSDGDGIPDNLDPTPNGGNEVAQEFFVSKEAFDENGDCVYRQIWTANEFGEILDIVEYGDVTAYNRIKAQEQDGTLIENNPYLNPFKDNENDNVHDIEDLETEMNKKIDGSVQGDLPLFPTNPEQEQDSNETMDDQGVSDPGSQDQTTEKDYTNQLGAMIGNQNTSIANQAAMGQRQETTNKLLSEVSNKLDAPNIITVGANGQPLTSDGVAAGVSEALESDNAAGETAAGGMSGVQDPTFDTDVTGVVPDENPVGDIIDGLMQDNPVVGYLEQISLQTTGACELEFQWQWDDVTHTNKLTMCEFQDELNIFGGILLSITTILSVIYVARR